MAVGKREVEEAPGEDRAFSPGANAALESFGSNGQAHVLRQGRAAPALEKARKCKSKTEAEASGKEFF